MGELNIARQLLKARHEKKITQEELANYIGVSKAAVSKWESGASFPDITILPQLATYYNMSIDALMGYEPQMTKDEIRSTYSELKESFAQEPWDTAWKKCESLEKKYFSCFPLLLQMIVLYMNHAPLSPDPAAIYRHCVELAERIRIEGEDVNDAKQAVTFETSCYLMLGEPMKALDLREEKLHPMEQDTEQLGQIYQNLGNLDKATEAYQVAMYQHLLSLVGDTAALLTVSKAHAGEQIQRALQVIQIYEIEKLHPNTAAVFYITAAQVYSAEEKQEEAFAILEKYVSLCEHRFFPFTLHGDTFFDHLDDWFAEFDLGNQAPRSAELIRQSMLAAVAGNPAFARLESDRRYQKLVERLGKI